MSLTLCAVGLLLTLSGWLNYNASDAQLSNLLIIIGLIVQVLALGLFELATPRMGRKRDAAIARTGLYMIACWLVAPALIVALWWWQFWRGYAVWLDTSMLLFYTVLAGALATSLLAVLRHRLLGRT